MKIHGIIWDNMDCVNMNMGYLMINYGTFDGVIIMEVSKVIGYLMG